MSSHHPGVQKCEASLAGLRSRCAKGRAPSAGSRGAHLLASSGFQELWLVPLPAPPEPLPGGQVFSPPSLLPPSPLTLPLSGRSWERASGFKDLGACWAHPPSPGSHPVTQFTASVTSAASGAHSQVRGVRRAMYLGHLSARRRAVAAPASQSSAKASSLLRTCLSTPPIDFACFPVHSCRNSCLHFKCSQSTSMHFHVLNRQFPKPNHPFRIACPRPTVSVGTSPLP